MHRERDQPKRLRGLDRLRYLALFLVLGCSDGPKKKPPPTTGGRTAAVAAPTGAGKAFCEKTWGPNERKFARPAELPLPEGVSRTAQSGAWTWVNLWATWCAPCLEEMALLGKWNSAMKREGNPFRLELWTVDAPGDAAKLKARITAGLPGPVHWLVPTAMDPFFTHLGVATNTPIPIHALVDPSGHLRCVRVGAIHGRDYGQIKQLMSKREVP